MNISEIISNEFELRVKSEGLTRIKKCVSLLSEEQIYARPNKNSNSVANLIMHLNGNIGQYILSGIGGQTDIRQRDLEFRTENLPDVHDILEQLESTIEACIAVVNAYPEDKLTEECIAQGFKMTALSMIIHVIEHFSYHVGQIGYYTKQVTDRDLKYYDGIALNAKSR